MGNLIGPAVGLAGSLLGAKSQNSAMKKAAKAAAFNPWNVSGPGGSAAFNTKNRTASYSLDPTSQAMMNMFGGRAQDFLGGGMSAGILPFTQGMAGLLPGLFQGAQDASQVDPAMLERFQSIMGPEIARQQGAAGGLFDAAQGFLSGTDGGSMRSGNLFDFGMGMLNERPGQSYQDVASQKTDLLRQLAAPYEERARNSMFQKLYGMGQLGMPGGERALQAFGAGLGETDLRRQLAGQDLAEGLYGRDLQASLARNQVGAGLAGTGLEGLFRGAGMGLDAASLGMGASLNAANMGNMRFSGEGLFSDLINARADQRMNNARNMFGFGVDLQSTELQNAIAALGGFQGFINQGQNILGLGAELGRSGAQAGANQAQYLSQVRSPWASVLQGVGMGMMGGGGGAGGSPFSSMFGSIGGGITNALTNAWQGRNLLKPGFGAKIPGGITIREPASIWGPSGPPVFNFSSGGG